MDACFFKAMMYQRFIDFTRGRCLVEPHDRVLLGVSGGIDSVVMMHLFLQAGWPVGVAHCNYQLRGGESEGDRDFVRSLAEKYQVPFYEKRFDTQEYAREHGLSIQMAARRLRYRWFEQLRQDKGYDHVAMGHNKDDLAETFLINLSRGTGLKGLTGIKAARGTLIRPLLFASRGEIAAYCHEQGISYREDSSNRQTYYNRNKIRHHVIPVFRELNPRFLDTMMENTGRLQDVYHLYRMFIEEKKRELVRQKGPDTYISKQQVGGEAYATFLYELLRDYGFGGDVVQQIAHEIDGTPGKEYYSESHRLLRDREWLVVSPLAGGQQQVSGHPPRYYLEEDVEEVQEPIKLRVKKFERAEGWRIPRDRDVACIDYDKLVFPLILRRWQHGDYFKPLGLDHLKKLSDFFVDRKYSRLEKEQAWLLTCGEKVVWVVGDRLDERFKVDRYTRHILQITYQRHT